MSLLQRRGCFPPSASLRVLYAKADRLAEKAAAEDDDPAWDAMANTAMANREAFEDEHFLGANAPQARTLADVVLLAEVATKIGWPEPEYPDFTGCDRLGHALSVLVIAIRALARRHGVVEV